MQNREEHEEKGKGIEEEDTEKEILSIYDDSEDEVNIHNFELEKEAPGYENYGRGGRSGRIQMRKRGREDEEGYQFEEEGEDYERRVGRRGRRGRGGQRRRGGAGKRGGRGRISIGRLAEAGEAGRIRKGRKGRREIGTRVQTAERAYCQNTNPKIRRIIEHLKEESMHAQSELKMEDWEYLLSDSGNTRG